MPDTARVRREGIGKHAILSPALGFPQRVLGLGFPQRVLTLQLPNMVPQRVFGPFRLPNLGKLVLELVIALLELPELAQRVGELRGADDEAH